MNRTLAEAIRDTAHRLRRSLKMDRTGEPFYAEVDEAAHDLETLARHAEGASHETISDRRIG